MRNQILLTVAILIIAVIACTKIGVEPKQPELAAKPNRTSSTSGSNGGGSLWPQSPVPPQPAILYPVATWVDGPCPGYVWPKVCCDTVNMSITAKAGTNASGSPEKLNKYRIVVDNVIVVEQSINGSPTFSTTYVAKLPIASMNVFDTTVKKWHSLGVTFWQTDGNLASQGLYIYR